ncbi:MAG: RagB/SusD family nutrient uptake outer membrane protein [Bacteroidales bacterium]
MKTLYKILLLSGCIVSLSGCSDYLNPDVKEYATGNQIDELGKSNPDAIVTITEALIQGVYAFTGDYQSSHDAFGLMSLNLAGDLSTEDMVQAKNHFFYYDYEVDNRNATYRRPGKSWSYCYTLISKANEVISKIDPNTTNKALKSTLGQALAMRAQGLHLAIQRFQKTYIGNENAPGVPVYLTEKDGEASVFGRGTVSAVYARIFKDYIKAIELLDGYTRSAKTMVDKQVACGLLARAYMATQDWANAEKYAKMARAGYQIMSATQAGVDGYNDITNTEWMWGFDTNSENTNMFASFQSHTSTFDPGYAGAVGAYKVIDRRLCDKMSAKDVRRNLYIYDGGKKKKLPYGTNNKFKATQAWLSDNPYMRASEMVLIEAEALAHQGKGGAAASVLSELMSKRDETWSKSSVTVEDVFLQKRLELWGEGVIFYDYLRLKKGINRNYPGSNHTLAVDLPADSWKFIYQIPQSEIDNNSEMSDADQNG